MLKGNYSRAAGWRTGRGRAFLLLGRFLLGIFGILTKTHVLFIPSEPRTARNL